jgi:hypothetical protein bfra3_16998
MRKSANHYDEYSKNLHKELPGLRGFSPSAIKNMRAFYEAWQGLDINSLTAVGELETNSAVATAEMPEQL